MAKIRSTITSTALIAITLTTGCSQGNTSLATGMKMSDAISEMKRRGMEPQQMAYATPHNAFDLPDGQTVVLHGNNTVDEIEVIANPAEPKSNRKSYSVTTIKF